MSEKPVNDAPVKPSFDLTIILFFFKFLVLLLMLSAVVTRFQTISKIQDNAADIETMVKPRLQENKLKYKKHKCDSYKSFTDQSMCGLLSTDIYNDRYYIKDSLYSSSQFYNSYWFLLSYIPGIIAAVLLILGRVVRPAALVVMCSFVLMAGIFGGIVAIILIFAAFMAMFGHGYRLLMVPEENHKDQASD